MATSTQSSLMGLPNEIRQLILLEVFDDKQMTIQAQPHKDRYKPSFGTESLLVCRSMRSEAFTVLMRGIELQIETICALEYAELLPADIHGGWLDPSAISHLPNLESIYILDNGEHSCEVSSAESLEDLQEEIENLDAAIDNDEYLWDSNHIDVHRLSELDHAVIVHITLLLSICWDEEFEEIRACGEGYTDVVATYHSKDETWPLQEETGTVKFSRGSVTITPYVKE